MSLTVTVKDELARVVPGPMPQRRAEVASMLRFAGGLHIVSGQIFQKIGRAVQQECRDRSRMPSSA